MLFFINKIKSYSRVSCVRATQRRKAHYSSRIYIEKTKKKSMHVDKCIASDTVIHHHRSFGSKDSNEIDYQGGLLFRNSLYA